MRVRLSARFDCMRRGLIGRRCVHYLHTSRSSVRGAPRTTVQRYMYSTLLSQSSKPQKSYTGRSGAKYIVDEVLQEEEAPPRRVYHATDGSGRKVILKYIHGVNYSYLESEIYARLRSHAECVRLMEDTIPDESMFVFNCFRGHLLSLAQKDLPLMTTKRILKHALQGIQEMHDKEIIHTDIKADNVLVDWDERPDGISIKQVKLADLEDAAHLPPDCAVIGKQAGNYMWRSPEAHACGPIGKPSDIFSFAIVMIYAVTKRVIFSVADDQLDDGKLERVAIVIDRQMSFFGELDSINTFIENDLAADNPWRDGFGKDHTRMPFKLSTASDEDFKDLIVKMTDFSPAKRITAREALQHKWFEGV